jgi:hypothetical protein
MEAVGLDLDINLLLGPITQRLAAAGEPDHLVVDVDAHVDGEPGLARHTKSCVKRHHHSIQVVPNPTQTLSYRP